MRQCNGACRRLSFPVFFVAVLLACLLLPVGSAWADQVGTVTGEEVNIRSGAGTEYDKIGSASRGQSFVVVNQQGDWYQIRFSSSVNAWISGQYLNLSSNSSLPGTVRATSGSVNLRSGPSTADSLLGTLSGSTALNVTGESGHWYAVSYGGSTAYVAKWLVTADYTGSAGGGSTDAGTSTGSGADSGGGTTTTPSTPTTPVNAADYAKYAQALVNTETLNLRDAPSGEILDKLSQGTRLYVHSSQEGWYDVTTAAGTRGWVFGEYLHFDQAQSGAVSLGGASAPSFVGMEPQGRIEVSWQQYSYGYRLTLEGDTQIHYQTQDGARSLRLTTDMEFTGALPGDGTISMSFGGIFTNELTITGSEALHHRLAVEDHGRRLVLTVGLSPLVGRVVFLDPGHASYSESGRIDPGTLREDLNLYEKDIVYDIALRMQQILTDKGATVVLSRAETSTTTLAERAQAASVAGADVLVSIHVNAANSSSASGSSTWYHAPANDDSYDRPARQLLAQCLLDQLLAYGGLGNYGVREANFAILRHSEMPAVLVETGFITNDGDAAKLGDATWRQRAAEGLCQGLVDYFEQIQ